MSPALDLAAGAELLRIDLDQQWEVDYWTRKFGIDHEELCRAVAATGPAVVSVAHLLSVSGNNNLAGGQRDIESSDRQRVNERGPR